MDLVATARKQLHKPIDFSKLSAEEARVEIAKDALSAIDMEAIEISTGLYFYLFSDSEKYEHLELREALGEGAQCGVCALGSLFLAVAGRMNDYCMIAGIGRSMGYTIRDRLLTYFSSAQLALIEASFEGSMTGVTHSDLVTSAWYDCRSFHILDNNARERLRRILSNIIRNKGTFDIVDRRAPFKLGKLSDGKKRY